MTFGCQGSNTRVRQAKHVLRRILAHRALNRTITAAVKPWAQSLSPSTLLRVPVRRIVEVQSPFCDGPVFLDTRGVDAIASKLYWYGLAGWEPETLPVFLRLVTPGNVVLDVGANTGLFSLLAARRPPVVKVYAIEPVPRVFAALEANVARNRLSNVFCHQLAFSDTEGTVTMYVPEEEIPVMASLRPNWRPDAREICVPAQTVDQFVTSHSMASIDVIKIDTEGTENAVLAGAEKTLVTHQPFVICEVLSDGNTAAALTKQLTAADYLFFLLAEEGPRATDRIIGNPAGGCHNYLFVPQSRLDRARILLSPELLM